MDTYIIKKAYHFTNDNDIEIKSECILFVENGPHGFGLQCNNMKNYQKIATKCYKIAELIREIEELNKIES